MANRMVGSPKAVRRAEGERNQELQHLRENMQASDAKQHTEAGVRAHFDRLREERQVDQARSALESQGHKNTAAQRVEGMDVEKLRDFESQQYSAMASLDAEIRDLATKEHTLALGERMQDASKRAVEVGVKRTDDGASQADNGQLSRKHRQERLVADRSARQEVIKRQKEHLLAERSNIESEMRSLQAQQLSGMSGKNQSVSHADTVDMIQMMRHGGGGQTFKGQDNSAIKAPENASSNTQMMVNQLASRYHEDRRKLQQLREQQTQLQKEIESTKFSNWKPSARDEAERESQIDAQVERRTEFAREVKFEQSKR